jgi:hypothetical protein
MTSGLPSIRLRLLISPKNEDLRSGIIDEMYASALYDGVAHVANTAPEATAALQIAAAQANADVGRMRMTRARRSTGRSASLTRMTGCRRSMARFSCTRG